MTKLSQIAPSDLNWITGGASRVTSRSGSNDQITQMLTQVTGSIKDLATKNNSSDSMMPMMMMMMMMGGGGGGGGAPVAAAPPPPPPAPPTISIKTKVNG